jgi:hypothetical protein
VESNEDSAASKSDLVVSVGLKPTTGKCTFFLFSFFSLSFVSSFSYSLVLIRSQDLSTESIAITNKRRISTAAKRSILYQLCFSLRRVSQESQTSATSAAVSE